MIVSNFKMIYEPMKPISKDYSWKNQTWKGFLMKKLWHGYHLDDENKENWINN